ncbi:MAG: lipoprotein [Pseudomonadales bacterium]
MYRVIAATLLTVFLAACGQTGPLYMPKDDPNAVPAPDAVPPAAEGESAVESETEVPAPEDQVE